MKVCVYRNDPFKGVRVEKIKGELIPVEGGYRTVPPLEPLLRVGALLGFSYKGLMITRRVKPPRRWTPRRVLQAPYKGRR